MEKDCQDAAKAAAEKLKTQEQEQRCRIVALEHEMKIQNETHRSHLNALSTKHAEQVHLTPSLPLAPSNLPQNPAGFAEVLAFLDAICCLMLSLAHNTFVCKRLTAPSTFEGSCL